MPLEKRYVRDEQNRIIGSTTTGYTAAFETIIRDGTEQIHWTHQREVHNDPR